MKTQKWWGYLHTSGTVQAKPYMSELDLEEADESPFVESRTGVFEAGSREEALKIVAEITR